jgi:hypothetical protein
LARLGTGLFVVSEHRGEIAAAIRAQAPITVFVDDAHHRCGLLVQLRHLREELDAKFRILATCWPGEQLEVIKALGLAKTAIRELELLTRKEIAQVIRGCGIAGPGPLLKELIDQAKGQPGLAVTLCYLCLRNGARDLASGAALFEDVRQTFQQLVGREAVEILASFAVGGEEGLAMETVASELRFRIVELRHSVERLAAGGVLSATHAQRLAVQPEALRHALVGAVFFSGATALPIQNLLAAVPSSGAAALTLTGAQGRGARVPDEMIRRLIESTSDARVWRAYASLGVDASRWVLEHRSDLLTEVAWIVLHNIPELAIPRLLTCAVGDDRPQHSHPQHPLRQLHDWLKAAVPGEGDAVVRRRALLDALLKWHASGAADRVICLRAISMVFEPSFEDQLTDPVDEGLTIRWGGLLPEEIAELQTLWPRALPLLRACGLAEWAPLRELIRDWAYPGVSTRGQLDPGAYEQMNQLAQQIVKDVIAISAGHPGVASWIADLASRKGWDVPCAADPTFEILYPQRNYEDLREGARKQMAAAAALAERWTTDLPVVVAERFAHYAEVAASVGHTWPVWTEHAALRLADAASDPFLWAQAMIDTRNSHEVVGPFLKRAVREQPLACEELWSKCYELPHLRGMAILTALGEPAVPEHLVTRALQDVTGLGDAIATRCLRHELPKERLLRLVAHPDPVLSRRMAWALWHQDPTGQVPEELYDTWRRVVVEQVEDEHTLKVIFESDATIAFHWLARRVGQANGMGHGWHEDEPFATAISVMAAEQRRELIALLTQQTWPREIVSLLIAGDPELYRLVLERPDLDFHHLEPLRGDPGQDWVPLARLALEFGFTAEEVARAARGMMWGWEGAESDMWARWVELFRPLALDPDTEIRSIGQAGLREAEEQMQRARAAERKEAVYGR